MITVKFFGMLRFDSGISSLLIDKGTVRQEFSDGEAFTVKQALNEVKRQCPNISEQQLQEAILFINKQQVTGPKRFSIVLKDGDELALLSPAGGG